MYVIYNACAGLSCSVVQYGNLYHTYVQHHKAIICSGVLLEFVARNKTFDNKRLTGQVVNFVVYKVDGVRQIL